MVAGPLQCSVGNLGLFYQMGRGSHPSLSLCVCRSLSLSLSTCSTARVRTATPSRTTALMCANAAALQLSVLRYSTSLLTSVFHLLLHLLLLLLLLLLAAMYYCLLLLQLLALVQWDGAYPHPDAFVLPTLMFKTATRPQDHTPSCGWPSTKPQRDRRFPPLPFPSPSPQLPPPVIPIPQASVSSRAAATG